MLRSLTILMPFFPFAAVAVLQRGAVKVFARRTVKGSSASSSPASPWYGPGKYLTPSPSINPESLQISRECVHSGWKQFVAAYCSAKHAVMLKI